MYLPYSQPNFTFWAVHNTFLRGNEQLCKANISSWLVRVFKNVLCKVYTCTYLCNVDISAQRVGSCISELLFHHKDNYHGKDF